MELSDLFGISRYSGFRRLMVFGVLWTFVMSVYTQGQIALKDVTSETKISFKHTDGGSGQRYIIENVSAGLALFDFDNDGDIDIYFLNGAPLKGTEAKVRPKNAMYRNDGNWKFTDVTDKAGLGDTGYGLGVAAGDYDNDGDLDVYLNNYGPNVLYRNNGDGTFTDVTKKAGVEDGFMVGAGACFLDMDKDGDLDLYVARYVDFSYEKHIIGKAADGFPIYAGPNAYKYMPDALYRNNGDGTFTDTSEVSGIAQHSGSGMGTICADYDNDGDTDIYIANDNEENYLFENDGTGKFEQIGLLSGTACDLDGNEMGSMGVDCADYDNDGLLDFYVTSYQDEFTNLYRNLGDGIFEDVAVSTGAGAGTFNNVTWGNGFVDFDNDGDRDIFVAIGHLQDNIDSWDPRTNYYARNVLLMNKGNGKFINVSDNSGNGLKVKLSSRGAAFDDLDNDGDIDTVILNSRREPTILRNDTKSSSNWIQIKLRGTKTNRDGIGAHVKVVAGDLTQTDEVHSGRGYQGHFGMRLHFGLGKHEKVDRIEVRWIGGGIDVFGNVKTNQLLELIEGSSQKQKNN